MRTIESVGLSKTFRHPRVREDLAVLTDVSLTVDAGEMLAIVGPSGSGKSTLLFCLAGLERPTGGHVTLLGSPLGDLSETRLAELYRDRIGFVFQSYNLVGSLSAGENIGLPARLAGRRPTRRAVEAVMARVGLAGLYGRLPHELSGGQQQRVALARTVFTRPQVIFADEPTGALDTRTGEQVIELLRDFAAQGATVVLVTHNIDAAATADRTIVLRDGRITATLQSPTPSGILVAMEQAAPDGPSPR